MLTNMQTTYLARIPLILFDDKEYYPLICLIPILNFNYISSSHISSSHYFCNVNHYRIYSAAEEFTLCFIFSKMKPKEVLIWQWTERLPLQKAAAATAPCMLKFTPQNLYLELLVCTKMEGWNQKETGTCAKSPAKQGDSHFFTTN